LMNEHEDFVEAHLEDAGGERKPPTELRHCQYCGEDYTVDKWDTYHVYACCIPTIERFKRKDILDHDPRLQREADYFLNDQSKSERHRAFKRWWVEHIFTLPNTRIQHIAVKALLVGQVTGRPDNDVSWNRAEHILIAMGGEKATEYPEVFVADYATTMCGRKLSKVRYSRPTTCFSPHHPSSIGCVKCLERLIMNDLNHATETVRFISVESAKGGGVP